MTYHAKGIWYSHDNQQLNKKEYLTLVGSSNYTQRSYKRDMENQFMLFTINKNLIKKFEKERNTIESESHPITQNMILQDKTFQPTLFIRFLYRYFKSFI